MKYVLGIVIVIALLAIQHLLSTRKNWLWGGILPVLSIPFAIWVIINRSLPVCFDTLFPFVGLLLVLLFIWSDGREHLRKKQQKELDKMKAKDIDE
ncbi:MAG: hypothetical protein LKJ17_04500 [Oscillospiraceae bacterium]|jgi:hypothetical protein|nr:hypothetical protein [Oscillospiraceae bacterium]